MSAKFDQYTDVITRLVREMVACTPQDWNRGILAVECDGTRMNYGLKNEDSPNKAAISEKLRALIEELYVRMARDGHVWTKAVVTFWAEGDKLKFDTSFEYAKAKPGH
jgi:hypothetical protein